ncbi:MAG TPA: DUF3788 family protein [Terracidiphilus sp.]|nr:DUF3788 family protein [Terracidiphilus sp.]
MEFPNAFVGHSAQPTPNEIQTTLGPSAGPWQQILDWLVEHGVTEEEWKSDSPKYGWSLRLKRKKRTILYLGPCNGCFRASLLLSDRGVVAAKDSSLSKQIREQIRTARRWPEGTGAVVYVKKSADLAGVRKLVEIKLAN